MRRTRCASLLGLAALGLFHALPTGAAAPPRTIELVLDASGSMIAKLPAGGTRLEAAKAAVADVVAKLPADTRLAFRAYGHQSPREKHDCADTQILVPFAEAAKAGPATVAAAQKLTARGYTPITRVLELAAQDLPADATAPAIVLVSDGKETCDGDPCATARALAAKRAGLVIHAIGFDVDLAARLQLQCIAAATGGTYRDAGSAAELGTALGLAVAAPVGKVAVEGKEPGNLTVEGANLAGHDVVDVTTGKVVGNVSSMGRTIHVPPSLYEVSFGDVKWKSVRVEAGKETVLRPGRLRVEGASLVGHRLLDSETGVEVAHVSSIGDQVAVIPGTYDVTFGDIVWPLVKVDGGVVTTLRPGKLKVEGASIQGHEVRTAAGQRVGEVSSVGNVLVLPPGAYTVEIGGRRIAFSVGVGETNVVSAKP